jgi:tRNA threonylcarbamoyl adenosine modification protein YeaZ
VLLLAIDTSGSAVTAAVHDGRHVLSCVSETDPRRHAELTAPVISRALAAAQVDRRDLAAVVAGVGPGPFTGLRVGVVTALVLGAALEVPVHGVCSLDALAAAAPAVGSSDVVAVSDARRREVYWARYRVDGAVPARLDGPRVGPAVDVPIGGAVVSGRGCELYPETLGRSAGPLDVDAGVLAGLAARLLSTDGAAGLLAPEPLYLRRPDAQAPGPRKRVLS